MARKNKAFRGACPSSFASSFIGSSAILAVLTRAAMSGMPTALGRAGETHELVDVILFMCSDNASFVAGTNHVVDGGRLCMYRPYVPPKD